MASSFENCSTSACIWNLLPHILHIYVLIYAWVSLSVCVHVRNSKSRTPSSSTRVSAIVGRPSEKALKVTSTLLLLPVVATSMPVGERKMNTITQVLYRGWNTSLSSTARTIVFVVLRVKNLHRGNSETQAMNCFTDLRFKDPLGQRTPVRSTLSKSKRRRMRSVANLAFCARSPRSNAALPLPCGLRPFAMALFFMHNTCVTHTYST